MTNCRHFKLLFTLRFDGHQLLIKRGLDTDQRGGVVAIPRQVSPELADFGKGNGVVHVQEHTLCLDPGSVLHGGIHPSGELTREHAATSALVGYELMFFHKEPGLRQIKHLSAGHHLARPLKWQATLVALSSLVDVE